MPSSAAIRGAGQALGAPALAMGATFLAFGAAVAEAGLALGWALACTGAVYGMAGQLVLLQVTATGGAALPATIAATAANARFLPMAVAIAPLLGRRRLRWLALPFIAITPWAAGMRAMPALPDARRLPWFLGFALASWCVAMAATAAGHLAAPALPVAFRAALLFANPLYFALLLAADAGRPGVAPALIAGVLAAPLAWGIGGAWGLPAAGLLGGTLAFLLRRHWPGRPR
ncbi:AzlC family ABC transporter permease [Falsiroseomonas selenitidurans]|uniref:AzlC family ABC transporter permease n=1 Tax=Falsiroseomonas selenitidurans TaxID=2716335 RepID=A0ABX1E6H3_9PROT|nr:AzlC family ABC transporter permease [Falsiroseomonas selenitidurans]NKC32340.1 AzlC family ABC transporter permease [Falsiroseomonas selenitidurans]